MVRTIVEVIKDWPKAPQESAKRLIEYYGEPDAVSSSRLIWYISKVDLKQTVLSKEEVPHDF